MGYLLDPAGSVEYSLSKILTVQNFKTRMTLRTSEKELWTYKLVPYVVKIVL